MAKTSGKNGDTEVTFNKVEQDYILKNLHTMTVEDMAKSLNKAPEMVKSHIETLPQSKRRPAPSKDLFAKHKTGGVVVSTPGASERGDEHNKKVSSKKVAKDSTYIFRGE